jgi:hypothetical protein
MMTLFRRYAESVYQDTGKAVSLIQWDELPAVIRKEIPYSKRVYVVKYDEEINDTLGLGMEQGEMQLIYHPMGEGMMRRVV